MLQVLWLETKHVLFQNLRGLGVQADVVGPLLRTLQSCNQDVVQDMFHLEVLGPLVNSLVVGRVQFPPAMEVRTTADCPLLCQVALSTTW